MKKFLVLFLAVLTLSSFADYKLISFRRYYLGSTGSVTYSNNNFSSLDISNDYDSVIFPTVYNSSIYFKVNTLNNLLMNPSQGSTLSSVSSLSLDRPITVVSNDVSYSAPLFAFAPKTYSLYLFCNAYYRANPESAAFNTFSGGLVGFFPRQVLQEILFSTNSVIVSSFLSELSKINTSLSEVFELADINATTLSEISESVSGLVGPLKSKPFPEQIEAYAKLSGSYVGGISPAELQDIKDTYNSLADTDPLAAARYADSVLSGLRQASDLIGLHKALSQIGPTAYDALSGLGEQYNQNLKSAVDSGFTASAHIQGATTNLLQRMTNDTAHIKKQLEEGRASITNQLERQWDGIRKTEQHTDAAASSLDSIQRNGVKIDTSGSAVPVVIQSGSQTPVFVNIDAKDLDFLATTINEGSSSLWDTWLNTWRDWLTSENSFRNRQRDYMVNLNTYIHSNYLHTASIDRKLDFGFTNIFDLIYTQLTNNVSTNNLSALLLDDYQTFIDSGKYSSLISSLPSDLFSALSSFGFEDPSEYSGRWWVFQSANMALQSQLALTNAALSSTLLHALSAIDDSDDSGGSLLSRWLSLIDSIPDPEEIQQSLSDATNIVSNIGFERVDSLYATATQDLVSVVKGIYQDKSLPDNIRFVFIPAASGRQEKYVDIPVGDHSSLWSLFRSGMAFALSVVTLLLFPKYVSWLVSHYTRLVERIIKSLHSYTHQ